MASPQGRFQNAIGTAMLCGFALMAFPAWSAETAQEPVPAPASPADPQVLRVQAAPEPARSAPPPGAGLAGESGEILERGAWLWRRLSYPTGRIPADPWGAAREHIERFVPDAAPWELEGVPLREPLPGESLVEPGANAWVEFGPKPLDSSGSLVPGQAYMFGIVAGRLNVIVSDPTNRGAGAGDRAWLGFAAGGVWRLDGLRSISCSGTCDLSGVTAKAMFDDKNLATQAVGAITIDPTDPIGETVWVGTGDWAAGDQFSAGLLKTTDGGSTWTQIGTNVFTPYSNVVPPDQTNGGCPGCVGNRWSNQNVKAIVVDPRNGQRLFVGTRNDLYTTNDGGTNWQICSFGNNPTNAEGTIGGTVGIHRVSSIYLDPRPNPARLYVAVGYPFNISGFSQNNHDNGVYAFDFPASGCPSWPGGYTNLFDGLLASTGTALSSTGRIELAGRVNASDGYLTLYAQISDAVNTDTEGTWVIRPDNPAWPKAAGNAAIPDWVLLTGSGATSYDLCTGAASTTTQDWYDLHLAVHPTNDKELYSGHVDLFRGLVNAGYSSLTLGTAANLTNVYGTTCASYGKAHPDQHSFAFVEMPGEPGYGSWFLAGNDGGIYLNTNSGASSAWVSLSQVGVSSNQFYAGQIGMDFGNQDGVGGRGNPVDGLQWLSGGMQDNGCATWDSSETNLQWTARGWGGDGMWTAFDSLGGTETVGYWITESQNGSLNCSTGGADGPVAACSPVWNTGESQDWATPIVLDQFHCTATQCRNLLVAGDNVYSATDAGTPSYTRTSATVLPGTAAAGSVVSLAWARSEPKAASAGTDNGKWWWAENIFTGANCTQAAANTASFACSESTAVTWRQIDSANAVLPNRLVASVAFDPATHNTVYAAVGGFGETTPSTPGHVFRAVWNGSAFTVTNKSGNLPDVPAQAIAVNPYNANQVFLGTYFGFYYTDDISVASPVWQRYMEGPLPNTPIFHLSIDRGPQTNPFLSTTLAAFTYGRGVYAIKLPLAAQTFCTNRPLAPASLTATSAVANQVALSWNDSASSSATAYRLYRALTPGGTYQLVTTVTDTSLGVGGSGSYGFTDTPVSGGVTYTYKLVATNGQCTSETEAITAIQPTGDCTLAPSFGGAQSVTALPGGEGCGLRVAWNAGGSLCSPNPLTYSVYRSTSSIFTPDGSNRIAQCVTGSAYDDGAAPLDTTLYYVVRAEDAALSASGACNGGNTDANLQRKSGFVSSTGGGATLYTNDFSSSAADWMAVPFVGAADSWQAAIQACPGGTSTFRFGNTACTTDYSISNFVGRKPGTATGITVPAGSTTVRLSFQHRWEFENVGATYYDGGTLGVSLDGTNYTLVSSVALLSGPGYTGNIAANCPPTGSAGIPVWSATSTNYATNVMQTTTVNLDAVCNTISGGSSGCAGQTLHLAWIAITDCTATRDGWFIDSVQVTRDAAVACAAAPQPVQVVTATGKDQQVTVEWVNPAAGTFSSTRVRTSTAGTPADPTAGTLVGDVAGSTGAKAAISHAAGAGSNGVVQYYSTFANSGAAVFSPRRAVSGLPVATSGNTKWTFSTPASALAPPIQGWGLGVFAGSNDRFAHAMAPGAAGGTWPVSWKPAAMNAPAQGQPLVMTTTYTGLAHNAVFFGSQDGYLYCFNAATGAGCTGWPAGGRSVASFGLIQADPMLDPATGRLLFGTRMASSANGFHAVNVLNGATAWSFTNTVGQGGDGLGIGIVSGPALILGSQVIFTSRTRAGGSSATVWALSFTSGSASLAWTRALGDIDASPTHDWTANRILVGTNGGTVAALNLAGGATVWSRAFSDGAVKTFLYYDVAALRLMFATNTKVWSIPSSGATGSDWSVTAISPSRPLLHFATTRTYVGACANAACTNGRLIELNAANSWSTPKTLDFAGVGGLGPVTIDRTNGLAHAGSRAGRVVAVTVPLP